MPQRQEIQLPQVGQEGPAQLQVQDSFGVSRVAPDPNKEVFNTLARFGNKVAMGELQKEAQANYASGQALRAAGQELTGQEPAPTRKGYNALNAKLKAQQWVQQEKESVDNGDNALDPMEYAAQLGERFKNLLTGDAETDQILTASMGQYSAELGRYQADANYKRRTSDGVAQATQDVRNHVEAIHNAKNKGDQQGEAAAREQLTTALALPTVQNSTLRTQLAADLSVMGLEMDDPSILNHFREQGVQLSPQQERRIASATAAYNNKQNRKLNTKYQSDTAEFEANVAGAKTLEEYRELARVYQEAWPERTTDKYMISQEDSFRRNLAISAKNKYLAGMAQKGDLGSAPVSNSDRQATLENIKANIYGDNTVSPDEADKEMRDVWIRNGLVMNSLKTELTSGLAVPLLDGKLHPNFQAAYEKALAHYKDAPDLTLKHLPEEQRKLFLDVRAATTYGGQSLGDAVSALEAHRVNRASMTREEREDFSEDISDAVDSVLGKGFFNWVKNDFVTLNNVAEIRTRLTALANLALNQGMTDPEAAVEEARQKILETHEQVGNSLIFNDGKPITDRMGIPTNRLEDAMDYFYSAVERDRPNFNRDNSILLGNPKDDTLLIGALNENGVISEVFPANMPAIGANFGADILKPEHDEYLQEEAAAVRHSEDTRDLIQESQDLLGWTEADAIAATSNIIGRTVTEQRVQQARDQAAQNKADQALAQEYSVESAEELEDLKFMRNAFSPGNTLTPEQIQLLQDGKINEYMQSIGQIPGIPDRPTDTIGTSEPQVDTTPSEVNVLIVDREGGDQEESYLDSEGHLTGGTGHRLTAAEQAKYPEGTEIPQEVRDQWFKEDLAKASRAANQQLQEAGITNPKAKEVFESVNFQLGTGWTRKFPKAWNLIKQGNYKEAAEEIQKNSSGTGPSKWMEQTPARVQDFVDLLEAL